MIGWRLHGWTARTKATQFRALMASQSHTKCFMELNPSLHSWSPSHVADEEDLARFLMQSSYFSTEKKMVKPAAFLPNPIDQETSVFRHGREPSERLWSIGNATAITSGRTLHGAAIFKAKIVREATLEVLPAEPPDRHAIIKDWPWNSDPKEQKAKQIETAVLIAKAAVLLLKP